MNAGSELSFGYTQNCETNWQPVQGDTKGFYIYKTSDINTASFYRFGLRIEEFLCQPNLETPLADMYTDVPITKVMYV